MTASEVMTHTSEEKSTGLTEKAAILWCKLPNTRFRMKRLLGIARWPGTTKMILEFNVGGANIRVKVFTKRTVTFIDLEDGVLAFDRVLSQVIGVSNFCTMQSGAKVRFGSLVIERQIVSDMHFSGLVITRK